MIHYHEKPKQLHFEIKKRSTVDGVDLPDRLRVQPGPFIRQVIAAHPGHGGVAQPHLLHRCGHPQRLGRVVALRLGGGDLAEVAATGALVPADEEGGLAVLPALEDVGAVRLPAHGVQVGVLDDLLQILVVGAGVGGRADPRRFAFDRGLGVLRLDPQQTAPVRLYSSHLPDTTSRVSWNGLVH